MSNRPNIRRVDEEGEPIDGDVEVNGVIPSDEVAQRWASGDDTLSPADGEAVEMDELEVSEEALVEQLKAMSPEETVMLSKLFKVLGQIDDEEGAGVVGHNTAETGDAIGVEGKTESDEGFGLYTEDDAKVEGTMESAAVSTEDLGIGPADIHLGAGDIETSDDIQGAIDSLPDDGGIVSISGYHELDALQEPDGTDEHRSIILVPSNVTLDLRGAHIKLADNQDTDWHNQVVANADFNGTENITVVGGVLDGNKENQGILDDYSSSVAGQWEGIDLVETVDSEFYNITAKNAAGDGIDLDDNSDDNLIKGCRFVDNGAYGFHITSTCKRNKVYDVYTSGNGFDHESERGSGDITADGCEIRGVQSHNDNYGIVVASTSEEAELHINDVIVKSPGRYGVRIEDNTAFLENVKVYDAPADDPAFRVDSSAESATFIDCWAIDPEHQGFNSGSGTGKIVVRNGGVRNAGGRGINIGADIARLDGVGIESEGRAINASTDNNEIYVTGSSDIKSETSNAICIRQDKDRVHIDGDVQLAVEGQSDDALRIEDGNINQCKLHGFTVNQGRWGIFIDDESLEKAEIKDVTVRNCGFDGILVRGDYHIIQNCLVENIDDDGIVVESGVDQVVTDNVARDVSGSAFDVTDDAAADEGNIDQGET